MLSVIMLSVVMLRVSMLSAIILSAVMLSVPMLSVVLPIVFILNVVSPTLQPCKTATCHESKILCNSVQFCAILIEG
jgi:hypothetical protein